MQLAKTSHNTENATLESSTLNWSVEKRPIFSPDDNGAMVKAKNHAMMVRVDTDSPLGVVGAKYEPVQNSTLWEALCESLYDVDHTIENAGHLDDGKKVFIQAKVEDESFAIGGDKFNGLITFWASHDGSISIKLADTLERIWCSNTFNSSMHGNHKFNLTAKHTANVHFKLDGMMQALDEIFDHRRVLFAEVKRLAEMPCNTRTARNFAIGMLNSNKTRGLNMVGAIVSKFRHGIGNKGETMYDLWNGFTEYYTHGSRDIATEKQQNNLVKSSELGAGARMKVNVFRNLIDTNRTAEMVRKGERILASL